MLPRVLAAVVHAYLGEMRFADCTSLPLSTFVPYPPEYVLGYQLFETREAGSSVDLRLSSLLDTLSMRQLEARLGAALASYPELGALTIRTYQVQDDCHCCR